MHFGEQKLRSRLIVLDDDGTGRGIYPRWGRVYAKGPKMMTTNSPANGY